MGWTLELSDEAVIRIREMESQVNVLGYSLGESYAAPAATSLAHCLATIIGLGGSVAASAEGNIQLYGQSKGGMEYGVVWFPKYGREEDAPEELRSFEWWTLPGTWSVHS